MCVWVTVAVHEMFKVFRSRLRSFAKNDSPIRFASGEVPTLHVRWRAFGYLGQEWRTRFGHIRRNTTVGRCAEIIAVRDEEVAIALVDKSGEQVRVVQHRENIAVAGWAPFQLRIGRPANRRQVCGE